MINTNSPGNNILLEASIPFSTPRIIIKAQKDINNMCHINGSIGSEIKLEKYSCLFLPKFPPTRYSQQYFKTHPPTTL